MPIENLLSDDERRQLEAVRLIALARDLLTDERERSIKAKLSIVLDELDRLGAGVFPQRDSECFADDRRAGR